MIMKFLAQSYYLKRTVKDPVVWRRRTIELVSDFCRKLLKEIKIEATYNFSDPDLFKEGKNYFMVCNHMSYMDILFLSAGEPAVFVTSVEMKNTPLLGELSDLGGSYFVERRDRSKVPGEIKDLGELLKQGFHVFVFPEGTSTNGQKILPFKRALFSAAIAAQKDVLPICLRIEEIDGEPFDQKNHDRICWYNDMAFLPHFTKIMSVKSMKVSVNYLKPISVAQFPDRVTLADQAYEQISACYFRDRPVDFGSGSQARISSET